MTRRARHAPLWIALATLLCTGPVFASCGDDPTAVCETAHGTYYIALPETGGKGAPALLWLHGLGGSGAASLRNSDMVAPFLERGFAVIAADGSLMQGRNGRRWVFDSTRFPGARDDPAFLQEVRADAVARFGIDADRVSLGGFSNGAFLVHYLACADPGAFARYLPVSGGFWRPHPVSCAAGPVKLFQTHGWQDTTVPLEGRPLGGGRYLQGDIFGTLEIWRAANGCTDPQPDRAWRDGAFLRRQWHRCAPGGALDLALFEGGHRVPDGWAAMVLDWIAATGNGG